MTKTIEQIWNLLIDYNVATQDELELVTSINGYTIDTLNSIIYARTAYRNLEQLMEEYEFDNEKE